MADFTCDASEPGSEHAAVILVTNLDDGSTVRLCGPHLPAWCAAIVEGAGARVLWEPAEAAQNGAVAPGEGEAAQHPPRPKRQRRRRENGEAALTSESSPFPDAAPDIG